MTSATQLDLSVDTVEEYLNASFHPDRDFVDDHTEERNMGELEHSEVQRELIVWFHLRRREWNIVVNPELRTQTSSTRFRVPDVCVRWAGAAREKVLVTPPLIAIEIMSPEDQLARVQVRLEEFLAMGVPNVWLIDPIRKEAYSFDRSGLSPDTRYLRVPNTPIFVDVAELFTTLD